MLNCKDMCEGWKNNYLHGIQDNGINKKHLWNNCPYCGAKLVDEEAELRKEIVELISMYYSPKSYIHNTDIAHDLTFKYNITRKGD